MININQLKIYIVRPIIQKHKDLIPNIEKFKDNDRWYLDLISDLIIGTCAVETYCGYYLQSEKMGTKGIYGMSKPMLEISLGEKVSDELFDKLVGDLYFATERCFFYYLNCKGIDVLSKKCNENSNNIMMIAQIWANSYTPGNPNTDKFYAVYCRMILGRFDINKMQDNQCTRCGYINKPIAKNSNINYDIQQPQENASRFKSNGDNFYK